MPLEPVVELLLVPVQAALASAKAVTFLRSCQPLLHVPLIHAHERIFGEKLLKPATNNKSSYLIVEIGHVPSILLIIVVVGIGAVVAWCNALSVGGGSSVVEVHSISTMGAFGSRS